jgi:hypothetical protein
VTVFLISVGVSLLEKVEDFRNWLPREAWSEFHKRPPAGLFDAAIAARTATATETDAASRWLTGALSPAGDPAQDPAAAKALRSHAVAVQPDLWPADLSAELDTFAHATRAGQRLGPSDTAILICSDTVAGLLAGVWNAVALVGGDVSRTRYLVDPGQVRTSEVGTVTIARVPGMDAGTEAGFVEAMGWMGALAKGLLDHPRLAGEPLECHLSGGYKAAIPYLIGLVEWIRSAGQGGTVEAFVRHEETTGRPIRLPLRRIPREIVQDELGQGWDQDGSRDGRPPGLLDGYAYHYDETLKKWKLTPYGVGLRAVFGYRQPGLGG